MTKLAYLSSSALCALALLAAVAPAAADGGASNELFGTANFGYDWTRYSPDGTRDFNTNTFLAQGTVGVPIGNGWSFQGNFAFESQQFNDFGAPVDISLDTWQVGSVIAYQFDGHGRMGLDMAYQTADFIFSIDGYRAGLRGEYYWMPNLTLRAAAGYEDYNNSGFKANGFYGGGGASYYFNRNVGLRGDVNYYDSDVTLGVALGNYNVWEFGGKLQYKCDDYPVAFGGHVDYAQIDAFGLNTTAWNVGVDITAFFGIGAANSSLRDAEANAPFDSERIGVKYLSY